MLSKYKVLLIPAVLIALVAVARSTTTNSTSPSRYSTNGAVNSVPALNASGMTINGAAPAGSSSSNYGQSAGGSAQSGGTGSIQGSTPPGSDTIIPPGTSASPTQPIPAEPDVRYPYDPPPFCKYPYNTYGPSIACPYCGNTTLKYPCGGCGGSGNIQVMCYPLE